MSGETQNYHETRNPITQTSDYSQITLSTTAKSIMSVTTDLPGSPLQVQQQGYWQIGKKWQVRMFGKATTAATPGNLTIEIRHQTGATVGDAGGTMLSSRTSASTLQPQLRRRSPLRASLRQELASSRSSIVGTTRPRPRRPFRVAD
jgi:hypothetical protein